MRCLSLTLLEYFTAPRSIVFAKVNIHRTVSSLFAESALPPSLARIVHRQAGGILDRMLVRRQISTARLYSPSMCRPQQRMFRLPLFTRPYERIIAVGCSYDALFSVDINHTWEVLGLRR